METKHLDRRLPLRWHEGPQIVPAALLIGFAVIFALFPISAATGWPFGGRPWCQPWMAWAAAPLSWAISLGILAVALDWLVHELDVHVGADRVRVRTRGIRGVHAWEDSLSSYRGVLSEEEYHSGGKNSQGYVEYRIGLVHGTDRQRDIELFNMRSPEGHRDETAAFARLLEVPVLFDDGEGRFRERDPDDLDKSIHELAAEGKAETNLAFTPPSLGGPLTCEQTPKDFVFRTRRSRFVIPELIFGCFVVFWLFGWVHQEEIDFALLRDWIPLIMGGAIAGIGFGLAAFGHFGTVELRVEGEAVRIRRLFLGRVLSFDVLQREAIEDVSIGADRRNQHECVRIVSPNGQIEFGRTLSDDDRQLVRRWVAAGIVR